VVGAPYLRQRLRRGPARQRPKLRSPDFRRRGIGGSPRFGSAHLRLRGRPCTGRRFATPQRLRAHPVRVGCRMSLIALAEGQDDDPLNDYIEAQVHGPLRWPEISKPSFSIPASATPMLERAANNLPCPWSGTQGSGSNIEELRRHRTTGAAYVELGCTLARDDTLTETIGDAARTGRYDEHASSACAITLRASAASVTNAGLINAGRPRCPRLPHRSK